MTEAELLTAVVHEIYRVPGLIFHHCRDSRRCDGHRGLPDLIIAGPRGILFRELKAEDGLSSAGQDLWAWTLSRPYPVRRGLRIWDIWRPMHLDEGIVAGELSMIGQGREAA